MKYYDVLLGLREKNNMSQQKIADKLNITQRAYAHYEKGDREPSIDTLIHLSKIYNVPVDVIVGNYELPEIREIVTKGRPKRGRKAKIIDPLTNESAVIKVEVSPTLRHSAGMTKDTIKSDIKGGKLK